MAADPPPPVVSPWLIALSVMLATFMEVLDTAIANVALPHIAGNLSASVDQATWVVTSYLVSNAIVLPASGWLSRYFGRKRFLMACVIIFTLASFLCGIAPTLGLLVFARVLQGVGGGALQPLAQAIMLESFPAARRGLAMAFYTVGVIVAPIVGPILGGWITDSYSWRWIFYINIPVGLLACAMMKRFVHDPPHIRDFKPGRIDAVGFGLMALGVATLQLILDNGQQDDWFSAPWIRWFAVISAVSLALFVYWERGESQPIVDLRVFANRNFAVGTLLIALVGLVAYVPTTLLPAYLQNLMGYTAQDSGMAQSSRGLGVLLLVFPAGYLVGRVDSRKLIGAGIALNAVSIFWLSRLNLHMDASSVTWPNFLQGLGMALVFVPLTTTAMGMLRDSQIGNAAGLYNLMRNIGASIGISLATTVVTRHAQMHQTALVAHATPFDAAYQARLGAINAALGHSNPDWGQSASPAVGLIYQDIVRQATALAYADVFTWLAVLCLASIPLVFLFKRVQRPHATDAH